MMSIDSVKLFFGAGAVDMLHDCTTSMSLYLC